MEETLDKKGKIVSFINMKGGVGKTTLCIGIGEYLARNYNKKILFIDLDPQFNTTQSLMNEFNLEDKYLDEYRTNKTVKKILSVPTTISEQPKVPSTEEAVVKLDCNIHIIPGTIDIIFEDNNKDGGKIKRVKKFIKDNKLREVYDYIFIDCPPTISLYTDAALYASDFYLVPNRIDRYSMLGITLLRQVIDRLCYDEDIKIDPLGIVYTMGRNNDSLKSQQLKFTFEKNDIVSKIGIFKNGTTYVEDLLVGKQGNIPSKYKKSREDIRKICEEFIVRIEENEKRR